MPWLAIPFGSKHRAIVPRLLGVQALPTLLIFDEKDKVSLDVFCSGAHWHCPSRRMRQRLARLLARQTCWCMIAQ
jgi:hypothetical protein